MPAHRRADRAAPLTATPKAFVFLVTDGVANNQCWYNRTGWTGSQARLLDPRLCQPLKDRGVTISVLSTPYEPIALPFNPSVAGENVVVNALNAMFEQAVARLTQ